MIKKIGIKKDDQVKILSGKDKDRTGKVLEVRPKDGKVIVEGLNIHVRFSKSQRKGEKGQRLELSAPIWVSKVILICPHCGKPTRVSHELAENGNFRRCKKCDKRI